MKPFSGRFFCNTNYSIFQVDIPNDMRTRPRIMKVRTHVLSADLGRDMRIPVGGIFRWGYFVGITCRGIFQYNVKEGENIASDAPAIPIEQTPRRIRGSNVVRSHTIVGLFERRDTADDCCAALAEEDTTSFDARWWNDTRNILLAIGTSHPLVSISRDQHFGVPPFLYDPALSLPLEKA